MSDKINGMIGYTYSNINWEVMDVVASVETGASNEYGKEILGIANAQGDLCLFKRGDDDLDNRTPTLFLLTKHKGDIAKSLRKLADEIERKEAECLMKG